MRKRGIERILRGVYGMKSNEKALGRGEARGRGVNRKTDNEKGSTEPDRRIPRKTSNENGMNEWKKEKTTKGRKVRRIEV